MLGESRLNVYVLGSNLSPRRRERIQAQVQTALRSLPPWVFDLLRQRIETLGVTHLPLLIEPQATTNTNRVLSLGGIQSRPAVKLTPRVDGDQIDWGQALPQLLAKAIAYIAVPNESSDDFWQRWRDAVRDDGLRQRATALDTEYEDETDLGLLLEMFAAYALKPAHERWGELTRVRGFLDRWRAAAG